MFISTVFDDNLLTIAYVVVVVGMNYIYTCIGVCYFDNVQEKKYEGMKSISLSLEQQLIESIFKSANVGLPS